MISRNFQFFSVLFFLFQTFRGLPLLPVNPLVAFLLLISLNTLKFIILKNYKLWILYLTASLLTAFVFSKCLKIFITTGNIAIANCSHFLIFSFLLFFITTLLSLTLVFSTFLRKEKHFQESSHIHIMIGIIAFTYLDSFFIRAFKDEFSFFATTFIVFSTVYKNIKTFRPGFISVFIVLFLSINLLTDFLIIYKAEILNEKINLISALEYVLLELLTFMILWRHKYKEGLQDIFTGPTGT